MGGPDEEEVLRYAANVFGLLKPWGIAIDYGSHINYSSLR